MRFGLLTQWYEPEPGPGAIPAALARGLAARGHEVQVLTGFPNYPTGVISPGYKMQRSFDEIIDGVNVRRVGLYANHNASAIRRIANYASFGASAVANGVDSLRGLDALWVNYSPITVAWPMWAARFGLGIPQVAHIFDLWPDTLTLSGFAKGGRAFRMAEPGLNAWCQGMYRASESVAFISPGMRPILESRGVPASKLHYVPIWADEATFQPDDDDMRAELGIADDAIVLLYAGALGEAQGLTTLIDACAQITDARFVCLIAGSGVSESDLRAQAKVVGAANVRFLGRLRQDEMTALMATSDFNYVGLRPHPVSRVTLPSKTQAALASGRALLVAAEGDIADVIRDSHTGFTADPRDPAAIATAIRSACDFGRGGLRAMGASAKHYYERTFSVDSGVTSIESLLVLAAATKGRRLVHNPASLR